MFQYKITIDNALNHEFQFLDYFNDPISIIGYSEESTIISNVQGLISKVIISPTKVRFTIEHGPNWWEQMEYHLQLAQRALFFKISLENYCLEYPRITIIRDQKYELLHTEEGYFRGKPNLCIPIIKEHELETLALKKQLEKIEHKISGLEGKDNSRIKRSKTPIKKPGRSITDLSSNT